MIFLICSITHINLLTVHLSLVDIIGNINTNNGTERIPRGLSVSFLESQQYVTLVDDLSSKLFHLVPNSVLVV